MKNPFGNGDDDDNQNMIPIPPNYATITNPETGEIRIAKVGFSFTSLLFNIWPSAFRGDWYNLLCMFGVQIIVLMAFLMWSSIPLASIEAIADLIFRIVWGFLYNLMYFRHKFNQGYVPADDRSRQLLTEANYLKSSN
ncbi:hypothetical protein [Lentilactobacillus kosonis]|uniref:Uncharacterized protein n=1 Tax=Lentilactobacillus kosonis TaxID=2810561 RepID=A0A401FIF6_9LACO|nr:hypothetical protein [Lentilactobacillus kosonis]GAY72078.1 hypothetical protein NBRC111893_224 [Lentilactobacillus kosonis]